MNYSLIKYHTIEGKREYAVIPTLFANGLTMWLRSAGFVVSDVSPNPVRNLHKVREFIPPRDWPEAERCADYIRTNELVEGAR